jgi:hypothetical protein
LQQKLFEDSGSEVARSARTKLDRAFVPPDIRALVDADEAIDCVRWL